MYRSVTEVTGCSPPDSGVIYCPDCCPTPGVCERLHNAVFMGNETDCSCSVCDTCGAEIEETVIHYFEGENCRYCGAARENTEF